MSFIIRPLADRQFMIILIGLSTDEPVYDHHHYLLQHLSNGILEQAPCSSHCNCYQFEVPSYCEYKSNYFMVWIS